MRGLYLITLAVACKGGGAALSNGPVATAATDDPLSSAPPPAQASDSCKQLYAACKTGDGRPGHCAELMPTAGPAMLRCLPE